MHNSCNTIRCIRSLKSDSIKFLKRWKNTVQSCWIGSHFFILEGIELKTDTRTAVHSYFRENISLGKQQQRNGGIYRYWYIKWSNPAPPNKTNHHQVAYLFWTFRAVKGSATLRGLIDTWAGLTVIIVSLPLFPIKK